MRNVTTIDELFDALGGTSSVARAIEKGQSTASEMRRRGSIPLTYWPAIIESAKCMGVELNEATLVRIHLTSDYIEVEPSSQAASHAA